MGLSTSHGCWLGSYVAFSHWREQLAEAAGYWVAPLTFGDGVSRETIILDWGHVTQANLMGEWQPPPPDPLMVLLAHHDCDGRIYARDCNPLADRLEALLPDLPDEDAGGHIGFWREKTQTFIDGLRLAASRGEDVDFH